MGILTYSNPLGGAGSGLGAALAVTIGAAIRDHNIHKEAVTTLAGSATVGAMVGLLGLCILPRATNENHSTAQKVFYSTMDLGFALTTLLTAPLMGERELGWGTEWKPMVEDNLIGTAILLAAPLAVAATRAGESFFSFFGRENRQPQANNVPAPAQVVIPMPPAGALAPTAPGQVIVGAETVGEEQALGNDEPVGGLRV
jgi:predicted membrane protein